MTVYSTWHCSKMTCNMHVESQFMQVSWTWNVRHNSLMCVLVMKSSACVQHPQMKQYSGLIITHYQVSVPLKPVTVVHLIHHLQCVWKWLTVLPVLTPSLLAWVTMPILEWGTFKLDASFHQIHLVLKTGVWQTAQVCMYKWQQKQISNRQKRKPLCFNCSLAYSPLVVYSLDNTIIITCYFVLIHDHIIHEDDLLKSVGLEWAVSFIITFEIGVGE